MEEKILKFKIRDFDENIDTEELSLFILEERKQSGCLGKNEDLLSIKKDLEVTRDSYKFVLIYAYSENTLVGFLLLSVNYPKFGLIWDWQPIVLLGPRRDEIVKELILHCVKYAKKADIDRLETSFTFEKKEDVVRFSEYAKWYEALGFYKVIEEAIMSLSLENKIIEKPTFSKNIDLKMISEVNIDDLVHIAYITFNNSRDVMFLGLTEELKKNTPKNWFGQSVEESSIILTDNEDIIGFCVVKQKKDEVQINQLGIHPNYRNQGLGKALINLILHKSCEKGLKIATLDVAIENEPAYNLYLKIGFKKEYSNIIFALDITNE